MPEVRIVRVIARLNVGGPAIQAITLVPRLAARGWATRLVRGEEGPDEGTMDPLAAALGVPTTHLPGLRRDPTPLGDLRALGALARLLRRDRPALVHTHAAKGGTLGRLAALLASALPGGGPRPVLVHTFHGHSLTGYFGPRTARAYTAIERLLARRTDVLVAVSAEVRDDLVALGVADPGRFRVVPLGFDLGPFLDDEADGGRAARRARLRRAWSLRDDDEVVVLVARVVPIKRADRFLALAALVAAERPRARFVVVGDGELRPALEASEEARALGDCLTWTGFRDDVAAVCAAADVVVLTSDNEGTPVSLIEAQAAAVPVVATDVGGVRSVVRDGVGGLLAAPDDVAGLAAGVAALLADPARRAAMGAAGREHAQRAFALERLVDDLDALYRELLAARDARRPATGDDAGGRW